MNGKVENVQAVFVEFINHEPNHLVIFFSDHPNAIALSQAPNEVFFIPRKFETSVLNAENRRHVASDHPANMNAHRGWLGFHVGLLSSETPFFGKHRGLPCCQRDFLASGAEVSRCQTLDQGENRPGNRRESHVFFPPLDHAIRAAQAGMERRP